MTTPAHSKHISAAATAAGLILVSSEAVTSFAGDATTRYQLALAGAPDKTLPLQLSDSFDLDQSDFGKQLDTFLAETANRLRNPLPNALLTLSGIPLTYSRFEWPFHESTAGADTSLVHGQVDLAAVGAEELAPIPVHAKIAAALTVTFREIVRAPEQPFAESFILNAVRKTMDQGQLELVKSGNRQPVPVTTRFYSARTQKFVFNDTDEPQRRAFLAARAFWLSRATAQAAPAPVWLLDPRDAQYLNCSVADLKLSVEALAKEGSIALAADPAFATPTAALLVRTAEFHASLKRALAAIKPTFNEDMRGGLTNM